MRKIIEEFAMLATWRAEIGRVEYAALMILLMVCASLLIPSGYFVYQNGAYPNAWIGSVLKWTGFAIVFIGPTWAAVMRLAHIGVSKWFAMAITTLTAIAATPGHAFGDAAAIGILAVMVALLLVPGRVARDPETTSTGEAS